MEKLPCFLRVDIVSGRGRCVIANEDLFPGQELIVEEAAFYCGDIHTSAWLHYLLYVDIYFKIKGKLGIILAFFLL
jgi:hypothetical protein